MAAEKMKPAGPVGDQQENILPPSVEDVLNGTLAPLNFCELTPSRFGISVQSFTPASSSPNRKDKSRLAQIKARRRSTIGVRGSPETNSLIRYMAQQRMKTPPPSQTPEPVRSSPLLPRVASSLRQKMASFQSLMDVEESDACDPTPARDGSTGGCIKSRDYLYDGSSRGAGKENNQPVTPTPTKRMRLDPSEGCNEEIREAGAPILHSSLKEQEVTEDPVRQQLTRPLPSSETVEEAQAVLISSPFSGNSEPKTRSRLKKHQCGVSEVQSPSRPPPVDPAAASPARPSSPSLIPSLPSLLEIKPAAEDGIPTLRKRKQVRFGGPLSPEVFDRNLPPSTPLQKGGTPARAATPGGGLQLHSLLKTPQRSESKTTLTPPDLCSPTDFSASPSISIPHRRRKGSEIVFPSLEENDSAVTSDPDPTWDAQPLNLDTAFFEESLLQAVTDLSTESDCKPSELCHGDVQDQPASPPQNDAQPHAESSTPTRSSKRTKKTAPEQQEAPSEAAAVSGSRKRKLPDESEPAKRSTRSAAKSASGKIKTSSAAAARRWSKDVDRSLYGSREYASKNPELSPITERLSFTFSPSPAAAAESRTAADAPEEEARHVTEAASEECVTSPKSTKERSPGRGGRLPGSRGGGRGRKKRRFGVTEDVLSEEPEKNVESQTTPDLKVPLGTPSKHPEQEETHFAQLCALISEDGSRADGKIHCDASSDPAGEESRSTDAARRRITRRNKRRPAELPVLQEKNQSGEQRSRRDAKEKNQGASDPLQENIQPGSDHWEDGRASGVVLAPWQDHFDFEDVFKPVATRGQRSVRRSLRNRVDGENPSDGVGLAWLPHTSPESAKEARRRTRGRRLSAAPPNQPSLPEETLDSS